MTSDSIKDQIKKPKMVPVLKKGVITEVEDNPDKVRYEFVSPNQFFSNVINLLPMQNSVTAARAFYEHKFITQALPIKNGESPNVQSLKDADKNESYEDYLGKKTGVVTLDDDEDSADILDVTPDYIKYKNNKGETKTKNLYNNFAFNRKTMLTNYANVKKGQHIERNKDTHLSPILAKTNYTDDNGTLNMGMNARVGMVPYKGWSMDDAVVISEDFAKKLTSQHMYQYNEEDDKNIKTGKNHFKTLYPDKYSKEQMENIDDNGVIKVGSKVNPGDPIIVSTKARTVTSNDANLGRLSKYLKNTRTDASQVWDHSGPGIVTDVTKTKDGYKINIEADLPTQVGDKLSTRAGNKLTISKIIPMNEMPRTMDGKPLDVLFNQLGLVSRVNANTMYEAMLGKVAEKTGKKYKLPTFNTKDNAKWYDFVENELKKNNLSDVEEVYDPLLDRKLDRPIAVGNAYFLKLHHTSESKISSRGQGIYSQDEQPLKGGEEGMHCFMGQQVIHTLYGPISIAMLCEKRLRIPVLTFDFNTQEWVYRNVTDWFVRRAKLDELITVDYCTNAYRNVDSQYRIFNFANLWVTKNHLVFREDGSKVPIGNLKVGDNLYTYGPVPTKDQLALLYGTLLGDGYAHTDEDTIVLQHGECQRRYVQWKQKILSSLNAKIYSYKRNASDSSLSHKPIAQIHVSISYPWIGKKFRQECYSSNGRKTITKEWLNKLTELSIVTLFLDDGSFRAFSKAKNKFDMEIFTMSFTREENQMLANRIKELTGINFHVRDAFNYNISNGKKIIYEGGKLVSSKKEDCLKMLDLVLKYCDINDIPKTKRQMIKFAIQYNQEAANIEKLRKNKATIDINAKIGLIPIEIKSIRPYKHDHPNVQEINVYDFTVEGTHAYLAGNVLVSNSKRHSGLENAAILSSGAYNVIKDAIQLRGQRNDDYWRKVRMGQTPTLAAKSPFIWDKYLAIMQGSGINTKRTDNGESIQATPFTDKDFDQFNPIEIQNDNIVDFKTMRPLEGGLFDPAMAVSNKWGKITLDQHYPNPAFEDTIISLLGIKKSTFNDIMSGKETLRKYGTGPEALYKALKDIDIDRDFEQAKQDFKSGPKSKKQNALNRIMALDGLKRNKMSPEEFMISKVPVLPPKFRPYSIMGDTFLPGDANELYQDVFNMANTQKEIRDELGDEEAIANSDNVYKSLKALYGYGDPNNTKLKQRGVSGFLQKLIGGTSKFSQWNRSVISKPVDFSARSVIDPNPEISMDEMVLPYSMGIEIYAPYIQRELSKRGYSLKESLKHIKDQDKVAREALETVAKDRWVTASRAPTWIKFGYLGFKPRFHNYDNILINPIISSGTGGDFDGDQQLGHVYVCIPYDQK